VQKTILITIDVEDWFQVENFKPWIPFSTWDSRELRVEKNTHRLLDLFDSCEVSQKVEGIGYKAKEEDKNAETSIQYRVSSNQKSASSTQQPVTNIQKNNGQLTTDDGHTKKSPKVTFFVLGWLAKRLPGLVREIHARGHEVASHGMDHELCSKMTSEELEKDLSDSKKLLEDTIGSSVYGYRAPSFAINNDILKLISDTGYCYDSSYNSFSLHGRYGKLDLSCNGYRGGAYRITDNFYELPISNLELKFPFSSGQNKINSFVLPFGGGGYFRLILFPVFKVGVKNILKNEGTYMFYAHPWEIDPEQPRVNEAAKSYKFRHYTNLYKTHSKLAKLLNSFKHCRFITCRHYLEQINF
jgi:polysaccharide deacetylase family protein (PEP-CTERM system associated)